MVALGVSSSTSGDGYGAGYGAGYGYGSGYGEREAYAAALLAPYAAQSGGRVAWWRSDAQRQPCNGGRGRTVARPGLVEEVVGPLELCTDHALHATMAPWAWRGERLWIVALYGEVQERDEKLGALKREILAEVRPNPWA